MPSLNRCEFIGNLGSDPEIRSLPSGGKVANLSLACSESWVDKASGERKERTEWIRIVIWGDGLVRVAEQYLRKGSKIYVAGQMQTRKYQKDGQDHFATEIVLQGFDSKLVMLDGRREDAGSAGAPAPTHNPGSSDDIPFAPVF